MHKLGNNFYDCEESKDALAYLQKSFDLMESLPDALKLRHINTIQDLYNNIAVITSERGGMTDDEDKQKNIDAMDLLFKAEEIYEMIKEKTDGMPVKRVMNNFDKYLLKQSKAGKQGNDTNFSFYINQGLDLKKLEEKYTLTLYVMAQVCAKLGEDKLEDGMKYSGLCMRRQLSEKQYELKDWVRNAMTLSEAYAAREHFAQSEYLLFAALHVIPESDDERHVELRAIVRKGLGDYYRKRLELGVALLRNNKELIQENVSKKFIEFPELEMNWPVIENIEGLTEAKRFYRLANTQFQKAFEFFILDGFVTEHVLMK